jgi:hypothetical protein
MNARLLWAQGVAVVLLGAACTTAGAVAPPAAPRNGAAAVRDAQALAGKIDQHIARRWVKPRAKPAPLADDAEFLRRVYLDLAGRIPGVQEVRSFLKDRRSDKRARVIDTLLAGPRYTAHFTDYWRALLIPEAGNNFQVRLQQGSFETWLKQRVARNVGYDRLVRDLLTAPLGGGRPELAIFGGGANPGTFYLAKEFKPENLAAATARVFLGVSVECAQCHNHPFAKWKKEQFWGFAAFYSGIKSRQLMDFVVPAREDITKRALTIPGTDRTVPARFIDGTLPKWKPGVKTRAALAEWVTAPDNPYFARAAVNRMWAYLLGTGLVEPIDEMAGGTSTPSHPELLDLLAREFASHQFDLKFLLRAITNSKTYQRSSSATHKSQDDRTLFARMPLRGLTGEQLFDSLALATGYREPRNTGGLFSELLSGNTPPRAEFLTKFAQSERATEAQTSILQALALMNGKVIADATSLEKSETLAAVVDAPFVGTAGRVEALYLATLSRKPTTRETNRAVRFVEEAVKLAKKDSTKRAKARRSSAYSEALADVFWALLNSPEFVVNH